MNESYRLGQVNNGDKLLYKINNGSETVIKIIEFGHYDPRIIGNSQVLKKFKICNKRLF